MIWETGPQADRLTIGGGGGNFAGPFSRSRLNIYFWFDPRRGLMLKLFILIKKLVNAITLRREFSILFKRVAICILLYSGIMGYDSLYIT